MISTNQWETFPDYAPEGVDLTELQLFGRIKDELTVSQDADVILLGNHSHARLTPSGSHIHSTRKSSRPCKD